MIDQPAQVSFEDVNGSSYEQIMWERLTDDDIVDVMFEKDFDHTEVYKRWVIKLYRKGYAEELAASIMQRAYSIYFIKN